MRQRSQIHINEFFHPEEANASHHHITTAELRHLLRSAAVLLFPGKLIYFTLLMNFAAVPLVRLGP